MRTTITLTPEADALVRRVMREQGLTFEDAVNAAIIGGMAPRERVQISTPARSLGKPGVSLDRPHQPSGDLEIQELLREQALGK